MTDYIACGKVIPERIATIVEGIARACSDTGTALVGGETAEHPGVMEPDDYDVAGAAVGVVEADAVLGPERVQHGDVVVAIASSGLHSNGFSLVRSILAKRKVGYADRAEEFGGPVGLALLEPTRLYAKQLVRLIEDLPDAVHALSHVTGGGIAANLARVLPQGSWVELDRSTWTPQPVFRVLAEWGGLSLAETEGTWNLGVGMIAVVDAGGGTRDGRRDAAGRRGWRGLRAGCEGCRRRRGQAGRRLRLRSLSALRLVLVDDVSRGHILRPLAQILVETRVAGELLFEGTVVRVRAEVLEVACDLGVLSFLTAAPHA